MLPFLRRALFSPCKCSGSIGLVHQDCLTSWLAVTRGEGKGEHIRGGLKFVVLLELSYILFFVNRSLRVVQSQVSLCAPICRKCPRSTLGARSVHGARPSGCSTVVPVPHATLILHFFVACGRPSCDFLHVSHLDESVIFLRIWPVELGSLVCRHC